MRALLFCCLTLHLACGFFISANTSNQSSLLWPAPSRLTLTTGVPLTPIDPCSINYKIEAVPSDYIRQIINIYLIDIFKCKTL